MAFLEDKIDEIRDPELRNTILQEIKKLKSEKKFGLVFEEHIPELAPIYNAPIRPGAIVARKTGSLTDTYTVTAVQNQTAALMKDADGSEIELSLTELVVVKRFGEPIYPALIPLDQVETDPAAPYHTIIEADNYHALQLLEYAYAGKVDVIYIDPPYNTGARNWKYNNRYVDNSDSWRHSKWLAMMKKRLLLAMRLLKPTGIMCITIDDYEAHHLKSLVEDSLPEAQILGTLVIKSNPSGRSTTRGFAVSHEYAVFVAKSEQTEIGRLERTAAQKARYSEQDEVGFFEWVNFRKHGGANANRPARPKLYYPIYATENNLKIPTMEWDRQRKQWIALEIPSQHEVVIYPINQKGEEKTWKWGHETALQKMCDLTVKPDQTGRLGVYMKSRLKEEGALPVTWWDKTLYSATEHGTNLIEKIFGVSNQFPFPKSIYAVIDCLQVAGVKDDSLIVDFFAGSGTTLHATLLLNAADGGNRQCILVTNNEVSEDEAKQLSAQGYQPNDPEWEAQGICRSVTFPRCKYVIQGKRDDGTELEGEYLTGRVVTKEKPRTFRKIGFIHPANLTDASQKRELVSLIEGIPQNAISDNTTFFVSEQHTASILFNPSQAEAYLEALDGQEHITHFYLVTPTNKTFNDLKRAITDLLGPLQVSEEEKLPMKNGFVANLEYFKLEFLDPHEVEMGRQFAAILPILWLMAGTKGPRPQSNGDTLYLIPANNPFAVLIDETYFRPFKALIEPRTDLTHIFLVTDSEDAFFDMKAELDTPNVIMLYKSYLQNFKINTQRV